MSSKRKKFEVIHNDEMDLARKKKFTEHDILYYQPANPRQSKFINLFHSNTPCIIMDGHPGCVDSETEFLTSNGWKKISEYEDGDLVMQVDGNGLDATLVKPLRYIKEQCNEFYHIKTDRGIDQMLSSDHQVAYTIKNPTKLNKKSIEEVIEDNLDNTCGFGGRVPCVYNYDGYDLGLTDDEVRLGVAIKADASLANANTGRYVFRLKKDRKVERLTKMLDRMDYDYNIKYDDSTNFHIISLYASWCSKFLSDWMMCSKKDAQVIMSEYKYWDGEINPSGNRLSRITTTIKEEADALQYFGNICGFRTTINICDRRGKLHEVNGKQYARKGIEYAVHFTNQTNISLLPQNHKTGEKTIPERVRSGDGFMYCFTVPTGYLVLRRNNKVFVTGNCGKTFLAVVEALRLVVDQSTHYEKVIYVRSAVTSGEDVGFLPSDMAAKADPYSAPLRDILSQITKYKDPYDNLIALGYLDFRLDTHMRGINLKNCVVIIDEAQCMDYASLKTILTRLDSGSRAVICGDGGQDDLKRKRKKSGWDHLKRVFDNMPYGNYGKVTFTLDDIVRGDGFTKDFIIADFETEKD